MPTKSKSEKPQSRVSGSSPEKNVMSPYRYENADESDYSWDTWETMLEWQAIWLKAIALAWTDPTFKAALLTDARKALVDYFDYKLPITLEFRVVDLQAPDLPVQLQYPVRWNASSGGNGVTARTAAAAAANPSEVTSPGLAGWYFKSHPVEKIQTREQYLARLRRDPDAKTEWALPRSLLVYPLPPPPQDVSIQAVALGDFSSAGRTYPFTCC